MHLIRVFQILLLKLFRNKAITWLLSRNNVQSVALVFKEDTSIWATDLKIYHREKPFEDNPTSTMATTTVKTTTLSYTSIAATTMPKLVSDILYLDFTKLLM